jgi:ABC-type polysaccharide/polyol phosphate export permease
MRKLLRELTSYRELLLLLVQRNIKIRYKNSALGFVWTLLGPIFQIGIYWIFLRLLKIPVQMESLVTGILVWQFLATCLGDSLYAVIGNANLITKTPFPRILLPLSTVLANSVNFLLTLLVLTAFLGLRGATLGAWWWLPALLASHGALCLGLSLMVCSFNVFFRDVEHILQVVMMAWFFLSPAMYDVTTFVRNQVAAELVPWYFLNPMAGVLTGYRNVFLSMDAQPAAYLIAPFALCWIALALGIAIFRRLEPRFGDEL